MSRFYRKTFKKAGEAPGTLISSATSGEVKIHVLAYNIEKVIDEEVNDIESAFDIKLEGGVTWINIDGLSDINAIEKIGEKLNIHKLTLEDILSIGQRPKFEEYGEYIFVVLKMLFFNESKGRVESEQLSIILTKDYVVTFQEKVGDVFENIRVRLKKENAKMRKLNTDFLLYSLVDAVVDHYFIVLEKIGEKIEHMEDQVIDNPVPKTLKQIHKIKSDMLFLRKSVWPLREVVNTLTKTDSSTINDSTHIYFRDVHDHTVQVIETIETLKDMAGGLLDTYLSSVSNRMTEASNRMNEVMKILTIFASIFIPLTFIAGVYGMNFEYMPELKWMYGYPMIWAVMIIMTLVMLIYYRKKKWI